MTDSGYRDLFGVDRPGTDAVLRSREITVITTTHAARLLGISPGRVRQLILANRMKGQRKIGRDWFCANPPVILKPNHAPRKDLVGTGV